jgi:hypothetical protein
MKTLAFIVICSLLASCTSYVQLYETKPISAMQVLDDNYIFENDTIKIVYSFWDEHGKLSYIIYNKLDIPVYVDWKKSSYVTNNRKLDYWADVTNSSTFINGNSSIYKGNIYSNGYAQSTSVKKEQITFIAPKSAISKDQFSLATFTKTDLSEVFSIDSAKRTDNSNKVVELKYLDYTQSNSPLIFRNFLTISVSDKFDKEIYIDNGFYVSKVTEMEKKHFQGKEIQNNDEKVIAHELPFKNSKDFYILIK